MSQYGIYLTHLSAGKAVIKHIVVEVKIEKSALRAAIQSIVIDLKIQKISIKKSIQCHI